MKNMGSTPILTNLVGVHPRNIHTKFEANPCSGSREETRGPVGLYRSPGVQNFINKVLGFSHKRSSSMMENI